MNYYGIPQFYRPIHNIDDWIRRRIRMCYWKQWRYPGTRVRKLMEHGVPKDYAVISEASSRLVNVKHLWCKAQGYR